MHSWYVIRSEVDAGSYERPNARIKRVTDCVTALTFNASAALTIVSDEVVTTLGLRCWTRAARAGPTAEWCTQAGLRRSAGEFDCL